MFDTEKIQRITTLLEKMPENFDDVYVVHDGIFIPEAAALFKRLKIPVRAIMDDMQPGKEFRGIPIIKTAAASANFNERTALIVLVKKPVPFVQTTFNFKVRGGTWTIPALVMALDEILAVYDRVMLETLKQLYDEDGISEPKKNCVNLAIRFARGLTTMMHPHFQNFKYKIWDSRSHFKPTYTFDDAAIVIQGPIVYENNYTAETFKLYRSIYPNVPIVVSTWQGEANQKFRRECQENSIVLLENEPPEIRGPWNVNLQLESSFQGVKYIREKTSAKFVLKTRTDQRINYFDFLVYFKNLLETFPPKDCKLQRRIILLCSATSKNLPFHFCDFLSFGHIEDISKLYDIPFPKESGEMTYVSKNIVRLNRVQKLLLNGLCPLDYNFREYPKHKLRKLNHTMYRLCTPERYIARTFYRKYIAPLDENNFLEKSWEFTRDYLILVDYDAILFDWFKYEQSRYCYDNILLAFARWLDMYRNFKIDWV